MADETTHPDPNEESSLPEEGNEPEEARKSPAQATPSDDGTPQDQEPAPAEEETQRTVPEQGGLEELPEQSGEVGGSAIPAAPQAATPEKDTLDQTELDALSTQLSTADGSPTPAPAKNTIDQAELDAIAAELTGAAKPSAPQSNAVDRSELDALTTQMSGLDDVGRGAGASAGAASSAGGDKTDADDSIAQAMAEAIAAESGTAPSATEADPAETDTTAGASVVGATTVAVSADDAAEFAAPELSAAEGPDATSIDMLDDVQLDVRIELGRTNMYIEDVLRLGTGSVVELDKLAGDPVDVYVNDRLIARGEVLVLNDNFCVRINDIHSPAPELEGG